MHVPTLGASRSKAYARSLSRLLVSAAVETAPPVAAMTTAGRRARLVAVVVVLAAVSLGSWRGSDHDFPFGPFRMYATSGRVNGAVRTASLVGVVAGQRFTIQPEALGLRRAELEGQYDRFRHDPRLLARLAAAYQRDGVRLDELRLVQRVRLIRDRRRVPGSTGKVIAVWRRAP